MTTYNRPGYDRKFTAAAATASNDVVVFNAGPNGSIGVSKDAYKVGEQGVAQIAGMFTFPKATGTAMPAGTKVYWDNAAKNITATAGANTPAGEVHADAAATDTSIALLINGRPGPNLQ